MLLGFLEGGGLSASSRAGRHLHGFWRGRTERSRGGWGKALTRDLSRRLARENEARGLSALGDSWPQQRHALVEIFRGRVAAGTSIACGVFDGAKLSQGQLPGCIRSLQLFGRGARKRNSCGDST